MKDMLESHHIIEALDQRDSWEGNREEVNISGMGMSANQDYLLDRCYSRRSKNECILTSTVRIEKVKDDAGTSS